MKKAILISIDAMRPDGFLACGNPFAKTLMELGAYTLKAKSVFPSKTLPCHMSMFHSVPPQRHGITTNQFIPFSHPLESLFDKIKAAGGISAMYYGWEPLRDVSAPLTLAYSTFIRARQDDDTDRALTDCALERIRKCRPDFVFLYLVETDEKGGHDNGWMSEAYLGYISTAIDQVKRVWEEFGEEYSIVVTADHGGHDRAHGTDLPEDMTIPMFFIGNAFQCGEERSDEISLLDLAPTIADLMEIPKSSDWEGRSLVK